MHSKRTDRRVAGGVIAFVVVLAGVTTLVSRVAEAHQDPPTCEGVDIGQSLVVTPPQGPIRECASITAETVLSWLGNCLIGSGNLVIGLADPSDPFNPAADQILDSVPVTCLGPATVNNDGCAVGQTSSMRLGPINFAPRPQDAAAGQITIRARWEGVGHQSIANQPQTNAREVTLPIAPCAATFCTTVECVPGQSVGAAQCVLTDASEATCPDNLFCSDVVCDDDIDQCVTTSVSAAQCPDNLFCADVTCDEQTDQCVTTDTSAQQCPDDQVCADVVCDEQADQCVSTPIVCDDDNVCTTDRCDPVTGCVYEPIPGCVPCTTPEECDDGNACTTDACVDDQCVFTAIPGCVPCTTPEECNDADPCTTDACVDDQCVFTAIPGCVPCTTPEECDDGNVCTTDACVDDQCVFTTIPGCVPCTTPQECDDGNACTTDACVDDQCVYTAIPGCVPCTTPQECNDADPCTTDACVDDQCVFTPIPDCIPCVTDGECNDADPCTSDVCVANACVITPIENCRPCEAPDDCADGDTCTIDLCIDDVCVVRSSFLAKVRVQFGNFAEIDGNLAVNDPGGQLRLGRGVFLTDGSVVAGDLVRLGNDSSVYAVYGNHVVAGPGVVVRGPTGGISLPLTSPFCTVPEFSCGTSRVTVNAGTTSAPLPPGTYGSVRVFNGGTLRLAPGTFNFCEIRTGRRTGILTSGPTTINVTGKVRLANGSTFGPSAGSPTPTMNVLGSQVRVGAQSTMQANLSAPGALLTMGRQSHLIGLFCVYRTRSDKRVVVECPPEEASSPSSAFLE